MFIAELSLYINYLKEQITADAGKEPDRKRTKYYNDFYNNLINGINYYRHLTGIAIINNEQFNYSLDNAEKELNELNFQSTDINQGIAKTL